MYSPTQVPEYFLMNLYKPRMQNLYLPAQYFPTDLKIDKHKKLVRITWPLWLYVALTGVIVYIMIKPYY